MSPWVVVALWVAGLVALLLLCVLIWVLEGRRAHRRAGLAAAPPMVRAQRFAGGELWLRDDELEDFRLEREGVPA